MPSIGGALKQFVQQSSSAGKSRSTSSGKGQINDDERSLTDGKVAGTYPRLARLADGSILAGFTRFNGPERILCVSKSTDNGKTFHDLAEVTRGKGDVDNLFLLEVPSRDGKEPPCVLAAFRNHDEGGAHYRITVCHSLDGAKTWNFTSQAAEKAPPFGIWEPFMRLGKRGEVQLLYSHEHNEHQQDSMLVVSEDRGATWTQPRCCEGWDQRLRDGMTGIASTRDGDRECLVLVFETTRHRSFSVEAALSYDDGATWINRHEVYAPTPGKNTGSPQIAAYQDGSLVIVCGTDEDPSTKGSTVKAIFGGPPHSGKIKWGKPATVSKGTWPGIMAIDDETALAVYDHNGPRGRTITWSSKH